jgi:hypothetical protein
MFSAASLAAIVVLLLTGQSPANARSSVRVVGAPFEIRYGVSTSTRFTVSGDGKVTVTSRATGGGRSFIQVERENCGFWGCHGYKLVGERQTLWADGATRTFTLNPGNSTRLHKLWISKPDDGRYIKGTVSFR